MKANPVAAAQYLSSKLSTSAPPQIGQASG
jgi:hypothetical protein